MNTSNKNIYCLILSSARDIAASKADSSTSESTDPTFQRGQHMKKRMEMNSKEYMYPMFIAALFIVAKIWKQPKGPSVDQWIKKKAVIHLHNGILCSSKKEGSLTFCDNMDGPRDYYAK